MAIVWTDAGTHQVLVYWRTTAPARYRLRVIVVWLGVGVAVGAAVGVAAVVDRGAAAWGWGRAWPWEARRGRRGRPSASASVGLPSPRARTARGTRRPRAARRRRAGAPGGRRGRTSDQDGLRRNIGWLAAPAGCRSGAAWARGPPSSGHWTCPPDEDGPSRRRWEEADRPGRAVVPGYAPGSGSGELRDRQAARRRRGGPPCRCAPTGRSRSGRPKWP